MLCRRLTRKCIYICISGVCVCVLGEGMFHAGWKSTSILQLVCFAFLVITCNQAWCVCSRNTAVLQPNVTFWHHQCVCLRQTQRSVVSKLEDSTQELTLNRHNTFLACFPPPSSLSYWGSGLSSHSFTAQNPSNVTDEDRSLFSAEDEWTKYADSPLKKKKKGIIPIRTAPEITACSALRGRV